jgi:hypothetical protein
LFGCDADVAEHGAGELGEEALDEIEPGAVFGREGEFKATGGLGGEKGLGLFRNMRRVIVEDQFDGGVGRIGGVKNLEEFDEFAAAVAVSRQGMDFPGEKIDAGQQRDGARALLFVIAREALMCARCGRQVRRRVGDRLNAGLFVVGYDRHRIARRLFGGGRSLLDEFHLAIDAQHRRHFLLELRVAAFEVIAHFVRFDLLRVEDVAHVPWASRPRQAWPAAGPCSRTWRARSRVVHNSCG